MIHTIKTNQIYTYIGTHKGNLLIIYTLKTCLVQSLQCPRIGSLNSEHEP